MCYFIFMDKISNFHTHTYLCRHAVGTPAEYIMQAQKDGCSVLGMSDHCPYSPDSEVYYKNTKIELEEVPYYFSEIKETASKVDFPVYIGFECEWNKKFEVWYRDKLLGEFGCDYLVFGPHWVYDGSRFQYIMEVKEKKTFYKWTEQTIEGIKSGLYKFVAHPDLFMGAYRNWDEDAKKMSIDIIDAAIGCGLPLEVNGNGYNRKLNETNVGLRHPYPYDEFWQIALEKNVKVVCNSDAHNPVDTIAWARDARNYAKEMGLEIIENIFDK